MIAVGIILNHGQKENWMGEEKDKILRIFYPLSSQLYYIYCKKYKVEHSKNYRILQSLETRENVHLNYQKHFCKKTSIILFVLLCIQFLSILNQLLSYNKTQIYETNRVQRPSIGEGSDELHFIITGEHKESKEQWSLEISELNTERDYTIEEFDQLIEKQIPALESIILQENEDFGRISSDLNLVTKLPRTKIQIQWSITDLNYLYWDGRKKEENIPEEGVKTTIIGTCSYKDYSYLHEISLTLYPRDKTEEERILEDVRAQLEDSKRKNKEEDYWELPDETGNYSLKWKERKEDTSITFIALSIAMVGILWIYYDKNLESKMTERNEQLRLDYGEMISKFTLYIHAGMTIKQAFTKLVSEYVEQNESIEKRKRYVYEEMKFTLHELQLGVSEPIAYERFGRRIALLPYLKFSTFIVQNLKKGNRGLTEILMREAMEAIMERKELTKKLGEQAGTKLLLPMMLMLVIVMAIIMIPAFMSFQL